MDMNAITKPLLSELSSVLDRVDDTNNKRVALEHQARMITYNKRDTELLICELRALENDYLEIYKELHVIRELIYVFPMKLSSAVQSDGFIKELNEKCQTVFSVVSSMESKMNNLDNTIRSHGALLNENERKFLTYQTAIKITAIIIGIVASCIGLAATIKTAWY